ncbi:amidohydrolase family protein [Paenibacillus barcinonensis]|uniref:Amidohydrolase family protein n=1 Tax=Paenibacillus barcinonensis TaxID=198119 RepID=A0A2V4WF43_PAEBA|nr:amidohydrolase family protein [Paenibacillus barcinonensis]PYE50284.1 L-fuconolactonase [Paenibacillus barcinonensis]QKS54967.1 amidohydrolase family protein [Paenibacillus barcinonensis]
MKLDAHQHFWNYNVREYGWIGEEMSVIRRSFLPEDLEPILTEAGVSGCVAVQARQNLEETEWLLELADKHEFIQGVVGWVDLCSEDAAAQLARYASNPWLKGVRHVIQDEPDVKFVLREDFQSGIALLEQHNLAYDLLVSKEQLPYTAELVHKFPRQRFVIDHLAKPDIKAGIQSPWKEAIEAVAVHPNVHCKLSGMVTEANWNTWTQEDVTPYLDTVLRAFGPERVMYGSDWPVCTVAGTYTQVHNLLQTHVNTLSAAEKQMIFGDNCAAFYGL